MRKITPKDPQFVQELEEDTEWEHMVPARFKSVCAKDSYESITTHAKEWS